MVNDQTFLLSRRRDVFDTGVIMTGMLMAESVGADDATTFLPPGVSPAFLQVDRRVVVLQVDRRVVGGIAHYLRCDQFLFSSRHTPTRFEVPDRK